jgi:hypothetical protein
MVQAKHTRAVRVAAVGAVGDGVTEADAARAKQPAPTWRAL